MIEDFIATHQLPPYRLNQYNLAIYQHLIGSYDELTTWPKALRSQLEEAVPFSSLVVRAQATSNRKDTIKVLFERRADGQKLETVLMKHQDGRNTVCVSCMIGCPVNCSFCATGKLGFRGMLSAIEIVDQVLYFARLLKAEGAKVTNVVYMGMGEPMLNLDAVLDSVRILTSPHQFGLSQRRITLSTSGYLPQFKQMMQKGFRGRIAVSLHAPNQELRAQLMPVSKAYALEALLEVMDAYVQLTHKRISYEYTLIQGVNDQEEHALQLVELFKNRLAHLNLIPYNPVPGTPFERSPKSQIRRFAQILTHHRIPNSIRVTMGDDIAAACGQLAYRYHDTSTSDPVDVGPLE